MPNRNPKLRVEPETNKTPKKAGFDENPMRLRPAWRVGQMELCDPFGWHELDATKILDIQQKLKSFESMTFGEILSRNHHMVSTNQLSKDAKARLVALQLDDIEELLSLRLTGVERVWGMKEHNIVILLWWDPKHLVCPSLLKHT